MEIKVEIRWLKIKLKRDMNLNLLVVEKNVKTGKLWQTKLKR
ncbi:hypothetical protein TcasGA2_TC034758 [Tribolium castaneum]|uniref:Uncharacterized protein n=1 Tax=Tribolium castaneum TaxID=7070 RepID=A0A139WFS1_TRICA|nr:hypothetical protein TcasGA2_TC034758 [Tribolium castaneum]